MSQEIKDLMLSENPVAGIENYTRKSVKSALRENNRLWVSLFVLLCIVFTGAWIIKWEEKEEKGSSGRIINVDYNP